MIKEYICEKGKHSRVVLEIDPGEIQPNTSLVLGFAGIGLIGPIVTNELIEKIEDMKLIGFVGSDSFPPISVFNDGILRRPFRLYYSETKNLIVGICELPFSSPTDYSDLAKTICNWALSPDIRAKEIAILQGIPTNHIIEEFKVFFAAEKEILDKLKKFGLEIIPKGLVVGPEATILNECLNNPIDAYILFTDAYTIPTPEGAAVIIEALNKIYQLEVDVSDLLERGKEIKNKMMELAQKAQQMHLPQKAASDEGYSQLFM
jgi:uncharacterized protein